ncbi:MAG: hypothetical protein HY259_12075, partial [Chloroflexi bacterium]|nr:hypothetical protein [Chloroflexota bacterium]MBI3734173.1 hypothetical protein [Chloroflexota bacterium]
VLITVTFATFDPHVLYDPYNNRWLVTATAYGGSPDSSLLIGASATSDPTGIWYLFRVDADSGDTTWADYPTMGFNKDWVAVSLNMFTNSSNAFSTGKTYVFNKANLFANNSAGSFVYTTGSSAFTLVPAVTFDNSLNTVHLVRHSSSASGLIKKSTLVGDAPAMPTFTLDTATVTSALGSWSVPGGDFLPQPNSARFIDVGDARMRSVVYRNGTLWCTQTIVLPAGGAPTHAALQWWQLDSNASSSTILQQGRLEDPSATQSNSGYHYAYPALAVNLAGDVLVGFSRFSLASYASAGYAYHFAGDAAGTLRDPVVLKAGEDVYVKTYGGSRNRWGDYSNTVVDPLNDLDMWTIQEYAATASPPGSSSDGAGRWATWWGQMVLQHLYLPTILK